MFVYYSLYNKARWLSWSGGMWKSQRAWVRSPGPLILQYYFALCNSMCRLPLDPSWTINLQPLNLKQIKSNAWHVRVYQRLSQSATLDHGSQRGPRDFGLKNCYEHPPFTLHTRPNSFFFFI